MKTAIIRYCICAGLLASAAAYAGDEQAAAIEQQATLTVEQVVATEVEPAELPLSEADLDLYHGGAAIVTANQTLTAITSDNVLNGDYVAGAVTLSDEALSNFDGFGNFAINTGAQVSIQSAMNVTINVGE